MVKKYLGIKLDRFLNRYKYLYYFIHDCDIIVENTWWQ